MWVPKCNLNVKLRGNGIKTKKLLSETQDGSIKQWITQEYDFPISHTLYNKILIDFKLDLPQKREAEKEIQDREQLLFTLQSACAAIHVIPVCKRRQQYLWSHDNKNGGEVIIEVATIYKPELANSVSIEHENLAKVNNAIEYLELPSETMKVLSYLDCLRCWALGKSFKC